MTTNSDREATASSCPDWLTDKAVADAVSGEFVPTDPWLVQQMAADILRLRTALSRARIETQRTIDLIADPVEKRATKVAVAARKAIETVLKCRELLAPPIDDVAEPFGLMGAVKAACEEVIRLRKENETLRREEKRAGDTLSHIHRCMASVDSPRPTSRPPYDIGSRVGSAVAELLQLRRFSKRDVADKATAKLAEVARILGGNGDVVQRAKQSHARTEKLSSDLAKALAERNEFAAQQVEGFLDWVSKPGATWSGGLRDAAKARAAELRSTPVGGIVDGAAALRKAMSGGSWCGTGQPNMIPMARQKLDVAAPAEDRVTFSCSKCSPQVAKLLEDLINRAVSKRVEAERAKHHPIPAGQSVAPMRRDASGGLHFDTSNWKHTPPPTAPQRFSLGTRFYDSLRDAASLARCDHTGATFSLLRALEALGAAVEAELSRRS